MNACAVRELRARKPVNKRTQAEYTHTTHDVYFIDAVLCVFLFYLRRKTLSEQLTKRTSFICCAQNFPPTTKPQNACAINVEQHTIDEHDAAVQSHTMLLGLMP